MGNGDILIAAKHPQINFVDIESVCQRECITDVDFKVIRLEIDGDSQLLSDYTEAHRTHHDGIRVCGRADGQVNACVNEFEAIEARVLDQQVIIKKCSRHNSEGGGEVSGDPQCVVTSRRCDDKVFACVSRNCQEVRATPECEIIWNHRGVDVFNNVGPVDREAVPLAVDAIDGKDSIQATGRADQCDLVARCPVGYRSPKVGRILTIMEDRSEIRGASGGW